MFGSSRTRLALATVLGLAFLLLVGTGTGRAADFKRVPILTYDGVKLEGTYYPNPGGKKDACVLLLHNFDPAKGGDSHADGWDHLAETLQKQGYVVLSFDFRGFGQSKTLADPMKFWDMKISRHNQLIKHGEAKPPETIDQKNFRPQYYRYLVNDVAAAKAFLDRENDAGACNTSNLVLIGAGEGAALGTLWLAFQCHLQRDGNQNAFGAPILDAPEITDVAAAVWLSISANPNLAGPKALHDALREVGRENKVPIAFVYGQKDAKGPGIAKSCLDAIRLPAKKDLVLKMTGDKAIADTEYVGSKLLDENLQTEDWILNKYLQPVLEARGNPARKKRDLERSRFFWAFPKPGPGASITLAKPQGTDQQGPIPLSKLGILEP